MKPNHTGLHRLYHALRYSIAGLRFAYREERAFRQEVWLSAVLIPAGLLLGGNALERVLLTGSVLVVLIVELLNTAIEAAVDRVGHEYHALAGCAKDAGSAAVLISLVFTALVWVLLLYERVWPTA